ncbi:DEAD/DEAH box helicase [Sphingomonas sp. LY160]|uniref:DEAD/DEAH box helicase n=1 Tax=Sphingomonas sp. LY160 TaxID=3095342 RepID=UPI002ADEE8DA|nr:DEAD/DEAH box helicase [Sphingomonas sp. LY160]MEA1071739.1 DEAD/DEAH box helicase [Sphingomonas sp. LY160]
MLKRFFGRPEQASFKWKEAGDDVVVRLEKAGRLIAVQNWLEASPDAASTLSSLLAAAEDESDEGGVTLLGSDEIRFSPDALAALDSAQSERLGLPAATPLAIDLRPINRIDQDDFRIAVRWVRPGGQPVRCDIRGALLYSDTGPRRIPEPLWSLYRATLPLAVPLEKADRFEALADLKTVWPEDPEAPIESEAYLQDLRVHYASSLSLKLTTLTPERTEFDPVLFGSRAVTEAAESSLELDEEEDNLLAPAAQRLFAQDRFRRERDARPVYVLRNGEYLFIDPSLRPALAAVRELQMAPEEQRRAFVLNPRKVLRERIGDEVAERIGLEQLFLETEQFSQRVAGVDVWRAPVLPWLVPSQKNKWIPEKFGLRVGEAYYVLPAEHVEEVATRVEAAASAGRELADVTGLLEGDQNGASPPTHLPVNEQSREALKSLRPFGILRSVENAVDIAFDPVAHEWDAATQGKLFLVVRDNFEEVEFAPLGLTDTVEADDSSVEPPRLLKTSFKPHQVQGLKWLAQNAKAGRPGALLADDMGLGKTLQAIAFMAWLQAEAQAGERQRAPFLIVAPTGLLGTWRAEIEKHLHEPHLGQLVPAFGGNLKLLKDEDTLGRRDIETGRAALDAANWRDAGVVLTTYETLRDYHFSFARTRFGLIIYDEIQKLKNPGSQVTRAAKALNSEFTLGMTGTPVENRLQDLWSIMDVVAPGFLGASRDFEKRHPADDADALAKLKSQLMDPIKGRPAYMLRRMKSDALEGLPAKHIHALEEQMPSFQAKAYRELVVRAAAASQSGTLGKGGMLTTLANMRGVSLHPRNPREAPSDLDEYARDSARLSKTLSILTNIAEKNEKALIFVEDLVMQERLAGLIQQRFNLPNRPMRINGGVAGPKRQTLVEAFQARPGAFDVMILSPRAGGVGLTITAANHVIHLSRWWNPAVEDQATDRVFRIGQTRDVHVYLPMAIHPDEDIRASSFDLRLNALIERKRKLTRDLFFPPDASDGELGELFREVSLEQPAAAEGAEETDAGGTGDASSHESANPESDAVFDPKAARPKLSLPNVIAAAQVRHWRVAAGEPRPTDEIIQLFAGRHLSKVTIRDPYALSSQLSRQSQVRFLKDLKSVGSSLEHVVVEYAPEADGDIDELSCRRAFNSEFISALGGGGTRIALVRRSKRARDDDFHDRFVEIEVRHAGGAQRVHELMIGRGVEALYNGRRQCTVTYVPPTS